MDRHKKAAARGDGQAAYQNIRVGQQKHTTPPTTEYLRALLFGAELAVETHNNGRHWIITGDGLRLHHWPSTDRWMAYGRVWRSSVEAVIRAIQQDRIRLPDSARKAKCRQCGAPVWWVLSPREKWQPVQADGDSHMSRCRP